MNVCQLHTKVADFKRSHSLECVPNEDSLLRALLIKSSIHSVNSDNFIFFTDLQPSVRYQFRVTSSATKNENIPWLDFQMPEYMHNITEPIRPINPETFPTAPYNLKAEYIASNSINLSWSYNDKNIDGFLVCQAELNPSRNCQLNIDR